MSSPGEWRAARNTKDCLYAAFNHTVFLDGREGVLRAGWVKTTGAGKHYPAKTLIASEYYGKDPCRHCSVSAQGRARKSCFPTGEGVQKLYLPTLLRPFARRRRRTARPSAVFILLRNPWVLLPRRLDVVFKCFFMIGQL